ncbi:MAG: hypothetical protein WCJ95_21350, partial [Mariniphaga sp.]
ATIQYVRADVVGTEGLIYGEKVNPAPWGTYSASNTGTHQLTANNLTSFGTFTGGPSDFGKDVSLTAFLEGPYSGSTMTTALRTAGLVPLAQPYNVAPWNYNGPESVASIPAGVVDWVLIELRQAATPATATSATIIKKRAAFIKSDGTIVEKDGTSPVRFYNAALTNNLYTVVRHRNHLAILANNAVGMTNGIYTYNFSTALTQAYGGAAGYKQIAAGPPSVYGMVSGDADADSQISVLDYSQWATDFGKPAVYLPTDIDMDGQISVLDYSKWATNFGVNHIIDGMTTLKFYSQIPK